MSRVAVILPAAGNSTRFGAGEKKPFIDLAGQAIWARTAALFCTRPDVSRVYVVISPADLEMFQERFGHLLASLNAEVIPGGAERFESVANALIQISEHIPFVAVHDAVRPLVSPKLIDDVFASALDHGAALLAVPVADTLKRVVSGTSQITGTVDRSHLWQAQTPQVFRRDWLIDAYKQRSRLEGSITDDAQLVESLGYPVTVVLGSRENFKITTQEDLSLATAVLKSKLEAKSD